MATYIKGNAVANATGYELRKKDGAAYVLIDKKIVGKTKYDLGGFITASGEIQTKLYNYWRYTEMIDVNDLADDERGGCVMVNGDAYPSKLHIAYYTTKDDTNSFVYGDFYGDKTNHRTVLKAADIKAKAQEKGAKYVVFCTDTQALEGDSETELAVNLGANINFNLSGCADKLLEGSVHTLVVRALGDGVNYSNSEYSNEIIYTA